MCIRDSKQTVRISGSKELKGEILEAKDFQFQLTGVKKDNGEVIQDQNDVGDIPLPGDLEIGGTVTNGSIESDPSNIFFGTITYDVQDAGTYKYSVSYTHLFLTQKTGILFPKSEK